MKNLRSLTFTLITTIALVAPGPAMAGSRTALDAPGEVATTVEAEASDAHESLTPADAIPVARDLGWLHALGIDGQLVVGRSFDDGPSRAFALDLATNKMTHLGVIPGGVNAEALAVDNGVIVGWSEAPVGIDHRAIVYDLNDPTPSLLDIGTLGGTLSMATGISGDNVVGWSNNTGDTALHSFVYDRVTATMVDVGPGQLFDVSGDVAVGRRYVGSIPHALVYNIRTGESLDLGVGTATAIDGDTVVGGWDGENLAYDLETHTRTSLGTFHPSDVDGNIAVGWEGSGAPFFTSQAQMYDLSTDVVTNLGTLGGTSSQAWDISGTLITGISNTVDIGNPRGVVWSIADDVTPPVLDLPVDIVAYTTASEGKSITYGATAIDPVTGEVPVSCSPSSGSLFAPGITTVRCSASDGAGNRSDDEFRVTVNSASAALADLRQYVIVHTSAGTRKALLTLCAGVSKNLAAGNNQSAVHKLTLLIWLVTALRGKAIKRSDADAIIARAQKVITWIRRSG